MIMRNRALLRPRGGRRGEGDGGGGKIRTENAVTVTTKHTSDINQGSYRAQGVRALSQVGMRTASRTRRRGSSCSSDSISGSSISSTSRCVWFGMGLNQRGADNAAAAAAAAFPRARDGPRMDHETTSTHSARNYYRAADRRFVLPADGSILAHSARYWEIELCASLWGVRSRRVCVTRVANGDLKPAVRLVKSRTAHALQPCDVSLRSLIRRFIYSHENDFPE